MSSAKNAQVVGLAFLLVALLACETAAPPVEPNPSTDISLSAAPASTPFFEEIQDVNPCTGQVITYTFTGTARIRDTGTASLLVASGTVATSDGFSGQFNRQYVINEHVTHLRFHDMEVSNATGQRIMFGVGIFHETTADGSVIVSFNQFSGLTCLGPSA